MHAATLAPPSALRPSPVRHVYFGEREAVELTWHEPPLEGNVPESVVQHLWAIQAIRGPLATTDGRAVEVVAAGRINRDGGPDFRGARVRIGGELLAGDVEVHTASRFWDQHAHEADPRYGAVVLHVTLFADARTGRLQRPDGTVLPELVLAPRLDGNLRDRLVRFFRSPDVLPCAWGFPALPDAELRAWLRALARTRLRRRAAEAAAEPDLDAALYRRVARGLGYRPNADAFDALTARVPLALLHALPEARDHEAVLLGAAGLLPPAPADAYPRDLAARFERLRAHLDAPPMQPLAWQRARLRPAATPETRVAQLAALAGPGGLLAPGAAARLAATLGRPEPLRALQAVLEAAPDPYWHTHYHFGKTSAEHSAGVGAATAAVLFANALLPVALAAGADEAAVVALLDALPAETDYVTARYALPDSIRRSALTSQALHELSETLCHPLRCLDCPIGQSLLRRPEPGGDDAGGGTRGTAPTRPALRLVPAS